MEGSTASRTVTATTMAEAFRDTVERVPDRVAVRTKDDSTSLTWSQLRDRVDALAGGLAGLGVQRGDTVALMFPNCPEFHIADLAVMTLGATPFSIYPTYTADQIQYVVSDAGAEVALVDEQFRKVFEQAKEGLPALRHLIVGGDAMQEVEAKGDGFDSDTHWRAVEPDDVLTLIYTSGTTGPPKGVELTHANLLSAIGSIEDIIDFPDESRVISWLPSAHVAERNAHHYIPVTYGMTVTTCDNPRDILQYLPAVRPTWFFAVPRIWEKLKAGLEAMSAGLPDEQRQPMEQALAAAREKVRLEQAGEPVPDELAQQVAAADERMFSGLRANLGLDAAVAVNVGAAPTPPEVLEFFHAIGIELAELWGMSETCGAGTCNRPGEVKLGTVGPPAPGVEIKLAEDGEVLVRGGIVMKGYRNQPDKTAETIDPDGWLLTGDIGEIDEDGFLRIVDRKKELIINAAGKNMSPANIESALKAASPLIGQAAAIGDGRPYNTALIVLDADYAPAWASKQGIEDGALEALAGDERAIAAVQEAVDAANEKLARVEQIKKFTVVPGDWAAGGDELTPTMKLKRKPIAEKYAEDIEAMYSR
ncbi:MAG: long-chain acyl-CoA synthetase [Solirubrobacteraceae bacterium]|jgi:long-subunit acyl-CoA synthetase (AMP-forming)|nr:long-chain acyl-CoA synthetase [Solirubrobacteraceae bacterium]